MNLKSLGEILINDSQFKSNVKFATILASAVIIYGASYGLHKRVSWLEAQFHGHVDVVLEKDNPTLVEVPTKKKVQARTSRLYNNGTFIKTSDKEIECLARNIYHEARFEPYIGQLAVAQVTFNRVLDGKWGNGFCDVVYAYKQFSWTLIRKLRNKELSGPRWRESLHVAQRFQNGTRVRDLEKAKWYHASYVNPKWRNDFKKVTKIQTHIFYAKAD